LIIKNSTSGNTVNNYDIAADNRYGQIFDLTAAGTPARGRKQRGWPANSDDPSLGELRLLD